METPRKITPEELQALFDFVRRKRVRYYDLQVELVDHFASAIEDLWVANPNLSFESAIQQVYDQFPVTGFSSVIDQQTQAIQKEAWRWVWDTWKSYFQWPRIVFSLMLILVVRMLFLLPISTYWLYCTFLGIIVAGGIMLFYVAKREAKKGKKRFLRLEATYTAVALVMNFFNSVILLSQNFFVGDFNALPNWASWSIAIFTVYSICLFYILFIQLPKKAREDLRRHFPKYVAQ